VLDCPRDLRTGAGAFNPRAVHRHCGQSKMATKLTLNLDVDLPIATSPRADLRPEDERALALAEAVIVHVLPRVAGELGVEKHRLAGSLLVELGYIVGLSHTPAAAVDALAVATERMRDALAGRKDTRPTLPAPNVPAPSMVQ
jgi:hypothetical protein